MSENTFHRLLGELEHAGVELTHPGEIAAWLTNHIHPTRYDATSTPKGHAMTLDEARTDIQNGAQNVITKLEDALGEAKTFAEQHVGALNSVEQSPVAKAVEGWVLPPAAEAFIADMVSALAAKYGTKTPAVAAPAEPETPAAA